MLKLIKFLIMICILVWANLFLTLSSAFASDMNEAIAGHVIQQKLQGNSVDSSVFEAEMARLAHNYALDTISILQKYLPSMLDSISAELRAKADKEYKCNLQSDEYKNKDCR
tara:strand:+ start:281 stop:616 length:336 start_codon:yes stop_codon:yes gene_type:complete